MNDVVVQKDGLENLEKLTIRYQSAENLFTVDSIELASALCLKAIHAGTVLHNLINAEDVCIQDGIVKGVVGNRSLLGKNLPIDPIVFSARAVIDATGHIAAKVNCLHERNLLSNADINFQLREKTLNDSDGERFVIDNVIELIQLSWLPV